MEKILSDLAAALRERLTIIADEESRRDPDRHTKACKPSPKGSSNSNTSCPRRSTPSCAIFSRVAATAKRSSCSKSKATIRRLATAATNGCSSRAFYAQLCAMYFHVGQRSPWLNRQRCKVSL
jgi:hypothetical protein